MNWTHNSSTSLSCMGTKSFHSMTGRLVCNEGFEDRFVRFTIHSSIFARGYYIGGSMQPSPSIYSSCYKIEHKTKLY